ncbi:MAG: ATP-binding protein [Thermoleophilaceae bacterium]
MSELEPRSSAAPPARSAGDADRSLRGDAEHENFTVDTGLFRELGELLVGRDSTALVELIKNAYDADARSVTVVGHNLDDARQGLIIVSDDGNGMTIEEFRKGFLRVASRLKTGGDRRSPTYQRRFTGAKGIGRLAAHKLARELTVDSRSAMDHVPHAEARKVGGSLLATINWDEVERHETLENVGDAISIRERDVSEGDACGTTIRLASLRRAWSDRERTRFVREVSTFQPGDALGDPIAPKYVQPLLFDVPRLRDAQVPADLSVTLGGDFDVGEDYSVDLLAAAAWVIEIDAHGGDVHYAVAPTATYARKEKLDATPHTATTRRDQPGAEFQARIFVRAGSAPQGLGDAYGVRVYMEGFRVLPYGEAGDDWLDVNRRYAMRGRGIPFHGTIDDSALAALPDREAGLVAVPLRNIFGGVFLTERGAPSLRMLVNREGFVPDESFLEIADAVSNGLALQTRLSAALRPDRRERGAHVKTGDYEESEESVEGRPARQALETVLEGIRAVTAQPEVSVAIREQLAVAEDELERVQADVLDEQAMLRVLASLGTQTAAFVHEVGAALGSIGSLKRTVDAMLRRAPGPKEIAELQRRVDALQRTLERQSAYLVEIVSPDARRRRSRRRYRQHFDIAALLLQDAASREGITLRNEIPEDLKTPPMFPAEITSIFTNLLSNAIKAAGHSGLVEARGSRVDGRTEIVVQNTGVAVDLDTAGEWFDPYRSTTAVVDPSLGHGMGLGLTITRAMLAEYRCEIAFTQPEGDFKTAVSLSLPA